MSWVVLLLATVLAGLDSLLRVHFRSALHQASADIWETFLSWQCQRCKRGVQKHIIPLKEIFFFVENSGNCGQKKHVCSFASYIRIYLFVLSLLSSSFFSSDSEYQNHTFIRFCTCCHLAEMPFSLF